jgi:hypothetical protein
MGLGPVALYGLGDARARALDAKRLRHEQIDPIGAARFPSLSPFRLAELEQKIDELLAIA